ncbi:hypothetical protein LshimejAT787_0212450 [Lyophyllum shimeji]|uniref:DUF6593 domain-containing protein n=1 Tax=Lyophyllum shimeji TaxID=47721 RepID=A0A9P3ULI5_LYOSH|nr:hypothetical protein LshimejAT787_0212450 [Lyophyllum shimeji]
MHLYLSTRSVINSTFANEDGQVLYKVETPMAAGTRVSTISMVVPDDVPQRDGEPDMHDRFAHLAEIEHHTKDYFRKEGFSRFGRNRVWTASDGREYKWLLRSMKSELVTNDSEEKTIAKSHRRSLGILGPVRPGYLEILPEGEHIVQEILITFIYVEKYRKEKERTSKY